MVVRVMAILLVLMFVLGLSSQIILYAGAENLGTSAALKARHAELSRQREQCQQELDALAGVENSAAERYEVIGRMSELISAQIEVDTQLVTRCEDECKYLRKALRELLTAANDEEVVLECGQENLDAQKTEAESQLCDKKGQLEEISARLQAEQDDLHDLELQLEAVTRELSSNEAYQQKLQELSRTDDGLEGDILGNETEEAARRSVLRNEDTTQEAGALSGTDDAVQTGVTGQEVVSFAVKYVGKPYKWGGESLTEGCDCSGFIKSVFSAFGIQLPHFSGALQHAGTAVEYDEAQLGDLICYDGHVGIYLGDDKMVNAFDSKHGIIICSVNVARLVTVRRVI